MHRPRSHRLLATLMAVLLLLTSGAAGEATHICPVHEAGLARAAAATTSEHASGAAQSEYRHHGSDSGQAAGSCCCAGRVCLAPASALPSRAMRLPGAQVATRHAPLLPEYARLAESSAYFIPFANGPPLPTRPAARPA